MEYFFFYFDLGRGSFFRFICIFMILVYFLVDGYVFNIYYIVIIVRDIGRDFLYIVVRGWSNVKCIIVIVIIRYVFYF